MENVGDRDSALDSLRRQSANLTAVVDACPLAVMLLDPDGTVRLWNPACERMFGWTAEEAIGRFLPSIPPERHAEYRTHLAMVLRGEAFSGVEAVRQRKGGQFFDVAIWAVPIIDGDGQICCLSMVADISERKRAERTRAFLGEVSDVLAASLDHDETIQRICRLTIPVLADYCQIYLDDGAGRLQRLAVAHEDPERDALARALVRRYPLALNGEGPTSRAVRTGQPVLQPRLSGELLAQIAPDPEHRQILKSLGLGSAISLPMRVHGKTIGALVLARNRDSIAYSEADVEVAEELGRRAGLAVENARLFESAQQARRDAERAADRVARLQSITAALVERLTPSQIASVVVEQAIGALGAERGAVGLLVENGAFFEVVRAGGYPETDPVQAELRRWERFPLSDGNAWTDVARTARPMFTSSAEERIARHPHLAQTQEVLGLSASATLPLVAGGQTIGVLWLNFPGPHDFDENDRQFLLALARHCSQALERASLDHAEQAARREAEAARQRATILAESSRLLAEVSLDEQEVLDTVCRRVAEAIGDGCMISLPSADGTYFAAAAIFHPDPEARDLAYQLTRQPASGSASMAARIFATGEPIVVPEIRPEHLAGLVGSERLAYSERIGFHSLAVIPLRSRNRTIGALSAWRDHPGNPYTDDDVRLVQDLTNRAAIALENARLYAQTKVALELRNEFLSVAAHELKTPMTALRGSVQLLLRLQEKRGTVDEGRLRERLSVIHEQSVKISRLVDQLLDISRIEAGRLILEPAPTDLSALVRDIAAMAQARSESHAITVHAAEPITARVDALRLEQVITNLVDNAIKYSPNGGPIELAVTRPSPEQAAISVTDRGIGIPPEHRAHIFNRFFQAHAGQYLGGMGLGLYISRQIVDLHGGSLDAEFPESGGTRFVVRLPS